jgi:hypothetical protein
LVILDAMFLNPTSFPDVQCRGGVKTGASIVGECHAEGGNQETDTKACIPTPGRAFEASPSTRMIQLKAAVAINSVKTYVFDIYFCGLVQKAIPVLSRTISPWK